jgi:hypothetical protein
MNALEGRASPTLNPSLTLEFCALSPHSNSLVQIKPPQLNFICINNFGAPRNHPNWRWNTELSSGRKRFYTTGHRVAASSRVGVGVRSPLAFWRSSGCDHLPIKRSLMSLFSQLLPDVPEKAEDAVNKRVYIATRP